jgi:hypothetical protein
VGEAECLRPYYWCEHCHQGQFPVDVALDIEDTELSPGVRRMMAAVGHEAAFEQGREQLKLLAGLTVTTKAVERTAETSARISNGVSSRDCNAPCSWSCPFRSVPAFPFSTWRWTAPAFP